MGWDGRRRKADGGTGIAVGDEDQVAMALALGIVKGGRGSRERRGEASGGRQGKSSSLGGRMDGVGCYYKVVL